MQAMICHEVFTDRDYLQSIIFSLLTDVHPGTGGLSCRSATRWGPGCCNLWLALQEFRWTALRSSTGPTDLSCSPSRSGAAPPTIPELTLVSIGGASVWQINFLTIFPHFSGWICLHMNLISSWGINWLRWCSSWRYWYFSNLNFPGYWGERGFRRGRLNTWSSLLEDP